MLVLLAAVVTGAVAQAITIDPDFLTVDAGMHDAEDFLPLTYENIMVENEQSFGIQFYTAEGEETETQTSQMPIGLVYYATTSPWFLATVTRTGPDAYQVTVATYPNNGEARTAYFKVYAYEDPMIQADPVYSNLATVTQEAPVVAVTGVTLLPTTATLTLGETVTLTPTVAPDGATDKSVTWSSSNTSVATVADGVVTAVAAGEATITVTTTDGEFTATCTVTVAEPTYTVSLKEGTDDATSWKGKAGEAAYQDLPLEGVAAGTAVSVKYNGTKKVKSVKAKKKAAAAAPALNLTSPAVGQVIGDDGKNYDYASLPTGVTAVAKICYVSGSNGLALALTDEGYMNWSTAITTCAAHTPAFTGGTWKLATQDEWNNMFTAAVSATALRDGFEGVGGSNLQSDDYWSSTDADDSSFAAIYPFNFSAYNFDAWNECTKVGDNYVRACLAW